MSRESLRRWKLFGVGFPILYVSPFGCMMMVLLLGFAPLSQAFHKSNESFALESSALNSSCLKKDNRSQASTTSSQTSIHARINALKDAHITALKDAHINDLKEADAHEDAQQDTHQRAHGRELSPKCGHKKYNRHQHRISHRKAKPVDVSKIPQCQLKCGSGVLGKRRKYRAVMLVLASADDPSSNPKSLYNAFKRAWNVVRTKESSIKVFFVYGDSGEFLKDLEDIQDSEHNLVYPKLRDSYPVYVDKVVCAMKHIDDNYDYDFFIKSNLSTFWDLKALLRHLKELANKAVYEGDGPLPPWLEPSKRYYVSGVDTIMNRYMVTALVKEADKVRNFTRDMRSQNQLEDQAIGMFMHIELGVPLLKSQGIEFVNLSSKNWVQLSEMIARGKSSSKTHYRVKSSAPNSSDSDSKFCNARADIDRWVTERLLREYYGYKGTL